MTEPENPPLREYEMVFDLLTYTARYVDGPTDFHGRAEDTNRLYLGHLLGAVHPDDAASLVHNLERFASLKDGEAYVVELRIRHPNGRHMLTSYEAKPDARLPNGAVRTLSVQVRWLGYVD